MIIRYKRRREVVETALKASMLTQSTLDPKALARERFRAIQHIGGHPTPPENYMTDKQFNQQQLERGQPRLINRQSKDLKCGKHGKIDKGKSHG